MAEDKVIPADIQEDADKLYPPLNENAQSWQNISYIQGRLDERAKCVNQTIEFAKWYESAPIRDKVHVGISKMYEQWQQTNNLKNK